MLTVRKGMKLLKPDTGAGGGTGATGASGEGAGAGSGTGAGASGTGAAAGSSQAGTGAAATGTGASTGTGTGAAVTIQFTPEQQALVDSLVQDRLNQKETADKALADKEARDKAEKEAIEQGKFKELAVQRAVTIAELELKLAASEHERLRDKVAAKHKLPADLAVRLMGKTEAELEEDAKKLAPLVKAPTAPRTEAGAGNKAGVAAGASAGAGAGSGNTKQGQSYSFQKPGDVAW